MSLSLGFILIAFSLMTLEWYQISHNVTLDIKYTKENILSFVFFFGFLVWSIIGGLCYLLNTFIRDGPFYRRRAIPLGVWVLLTFFFLFIFSCFLLVYSINIIQKLLSVKKENLSYLEVSLNVMSIRLTYYIIFLIITYYFSLPIGIYNGINFLFTARDLISNEFI